MTAPTGFASYNVQGSTVYRVLGIGVSKPEMKPSSKRKELLVLIVEKLSQVDLKVFATLEGNDKRYVYKEKNSNELPRDLLLHTCHNIIRKK